MITQEHIDKAADLAARFKVGQKITIFSISEMMANTTKAEIRITRTLSFDNIKELQPKPIEHYVNGPITAYRVAGFKERGKRKECYLTLRLEDLVFEGWDIPIKRDWDVANPNGGSIAFSGNACFNLVGDPAVIRDYVENHNLNGPTSESTKAKIILIPTGPDGCRSSEPETLLYDDIENVRVPPKVERIKEGHGAQPA
jgi:hypothetical protein